MLKKQDCSDIQFWGCFTAFLFIVWLDYKADFCFMQKAELLKF